MDLCSNGHEEVCYEGKECPACETIDNKDEVIADLHEKIENLTDEIDGLSEDNGNLTDELNEYKNKEITE